MSEIKTKTLGDYKLIEVPLNRILNDRRIPLDSPLVYIISSPIAIEGRINRRGNDKLPLNRLKLIKGVNGALITKMFLTTTTTSPDKLQIITADKEIFGEIGVSQNVVLVDSLGVEYDARDVQSTVIELMDVDIRSTVAVDSDSLTLTGFRSMTVVLDNGLDQDVTVQPQGSLDGVNFYDIGTPITVLDTGNEIVTLTDAWTDIKFEVTALVNPGAGAMVISSLRRT